MIYATRVIRDPRHLRPWVRTALQVMVCAAVALAASWGML